MWKKAYQIRLKDRYETLEYQDESGVYHFSVGCENDRWRLWWPGSKGVFYEAHEFSENEKSIILPRLIDYLSNDRWFGIFRRNHHVKIIKIKKSKSKRKNNRSGIREILPNFREGALEGNEKSLYALFQLSVPFSSNNPDRKAARREVDRLLYEKPKFWIKAFSKQRRDFTWGGLSPDPNLTDGVTWEGFCKAIIQNLRNFQGKREENDFADHVLGVLKKQFSNRPKFWKRINS